MIYVEIIGNLSRNSLFEKQMKNLWRESHKNHWGDKVNASGHFKTGFMKKYSDPAEIGALKEASDLRIWIFAIMS